MTVNSVPIIDSEKCTLCQKCVDICPKEVLAISEKKVKCTEQECMLCAHCFGVCPENAISFSRENLILPEFRSFQYKEEYKNPKNIKEICNIPKNHRIHAVLTAGYSDTSFSHLTLRKNYKINFI